ncbi:MAG: MmgE/PrpD family protein [Clostridiales bacterium]|nr:MmgE/PrpD family protein [Candidatus Crickella caballi]
MRNKSAEFFAAIDEVYNESVPSEVMARARRSLLDYLAVTCAGCKFQENKLNDYYAFAEPETGAFPIIGAGRHVSLKESVFVNGLNAHALDFDDGTNSGIIHLGSPIFSLLLPLAMRYKISVEDMLKAAITGYEASYTMAVSIQPGHKAMGYHATGTCGVIGATLAAAYMLGFSEEERFNAFATACVSASGMLKVLDDGSELKPYNVAKTSLLALTSLQLAKAGFKGHEDPLGGRGFLKMMTGSEDTELKSVWQNGSYAIMKSYTKPYASCRYTHPPVEAAIKMRTLLDADEIDEIIIKTYDLAVGGHDHTEIPSTYSAKMSTPYATAVAFLFGKAGFGEFSEELIRDEQVLKLCRKVRVEPDDELSAVFPGVQSAIVKIVSGENEHICRVDFPKGEPENPLSDEEFRERYDDLMKLGGISDEVADKIFGLVCRSESMAEELMELF